MALKLSYTRNECIKIITEGGSVKIGDSIIHRVENLPSAAAFAAASGDDTQITQALDTLDTTIAALQAQRDALQGRSAPAAAPDTTPVAAPPPAPSAAPAPPPPAMTDPKDLYTLTYRQAYDIAANEGVPDPDSFATRDDLVDAILTKSGYDPANFRPAAPSFAPPGPAAVTAGIATPATSDTPATTSQQDATASAQAAQKDAGTATVIDPVAQLKTLSVDQLKGVAIEAGVANVGTLTRKDDLIAAIVAKSAENAAQAAPQQS